VWSHEAIDGPRRHAVLAVTDDPERARAIAGRLTGPRLATEAVPRLDQAVEALRRRPYDALLVDLALPGEAGRNALFRVQMLAHRIPVVLMTGHADEELALQAVAAGIQEYMVTDGGIPADLGRRLSQAVVRHHQLRRSRQSASRSTHDPLTGLSGKAAFLRKLQDTLELAGRFREKPALLLLASSGFPETGERPGPARGAGLLREIARRLTWCVRRADSLGHLGDGELAVLLPNATAAPAIRMVAERLRLAASAPYEDERGSLRPRANVGAAWYPLDGDSAAGLLEAAQTALAEARTFGDGRCQLFRGHGLPPWPEDVASVLLPEREAAKDTRKEARP
jgi:diguanylate cyclase (GGDEF)-like protein